MSQDKSVASQFELYLQRSDLRPSSIRFKRMALAHFLRAFGDLAVETVTPAIAEDYRMVLTKGRSKVSVNGYLANFKPFWVWLHKHGLIASNPFDAVRLFRITESKRSTFTAQELSQMLRVASRLWRIRTCFGLLGCRRGEMLNVVVRDINLSAPHPHILLSPKTATTNTWSWQIKDHAMRMVALPERMSFEDVVIELHNDVVAEIEQLPESQPYLCLETRYWQKLIRLQSEAILTDIHAADPTGNFQRMFRNLQRRAGLRELRRFHELRAAFITKMIENTDLSRAAEAAGHSSVETTRRYHRFTEMSLVADMGRIAEQCYKT